MKIKQDGGYKMDIRKQSYDKVEISLTAGVIYTLNCRNRPNHFIINSSIGDVLYVGDTPNVGATRYSRKLAGISRQLYAEMNGLTTIYLVSASSGTVVIESYYSPFNENSISPTLETLNALNPGTPKAEIVSLTGGVVYDLKATSGWIVAFGSGLNPNTEIRNNLTAVWTGDYIAGQPFYNDVNIKLYSIVDNTISIVYL